MRYIYDTEIYPNFNLWVFKNVKSKKIVSFQYSETENNLLDLKNFLEQEGLEIVGFNNYRYDDELLKYLFANNFNIDSLDLYYLSKTIIEEKIPPEFKAKYSNFQKGKSFLPFLSIDLITLQKGNLKSLGVSLGHEKLQELPYDPTVNLDFDKQKTVQQYCINDVEITEKVYLACLPKIEARELLNKNTIDIRKKLGYKKDFRQLSDSALAGDYMALHYCSENNLNYYNFVKRDNKPNYASLKLGNLIFGDIKFQNPQLNKFLNELKEKEIDLLKAEKFEKIIEIGKYQYNFALGGLHSKNKNQIYKNKTFEIIDIDVASYYPSLIINKNIKPSFLNESWIKIYKTIVAERLNAKKQGNKEKADALKIIINSFYGNFSYKYFYAYDPKTTLHVTLNGQLYLLMLIEQLEKNGCEVISANTDGITYLKPIGNDKDSQIRLKWEKNSDLLLEETKYTTLILKDVNNYIAKDVNNNYKRKGCFSQISIGKNLNANIIYEAIEKYIIEGIPVENTINNEKNIHKFLFSKKADKKFAIKHNGKITQNINRYYVSNSEEASCLEKFNNDKTIKITTEKVLLANDINNKDIELVDKDFYINEATEILNNLLANQIAFETKEENLKIIEYLKNNGFYPVPKIFKSNLKGVKIKDYSQMNFDYSLSPTIAIVTGKKAGVLVIDIDNPQKLTNETKALLDSIKTLKITVDNSNRYKLIFKTNSNAIIKGNYINSFGFEILYDQSQIANVYGAYNYTKKYHIENNIIPLPQELEDHLLKIQNIKKNSVKVSKNIEPITLNLKDKSVENFIETFLVNKNIDYTKKVIKADNDWALNNCNDHTNNYYEIECPGAEAHSNNKNQKAQLYFLNNGSFYISCFHKSCEGDRQAFQKEINKEFNQKFSINVNKVDNFDKELEFINNCKSIIEEKTEIENLKANLLKAQNKSFSIVEAPTGCGKTYTLIQYAISEVKKGGLVTIVCASKEEVEKIVGILKSKDFQDNISIAIQGIDTNPKNFKDIIITTYAYLSFKGDTSDIYKLAKALLLDRIVICDEVQAIEIYSNKIIPLLARYKKEGEHYSLQDKCIKSIHQGNCAQCFISNSCFKNNHQEIKFHPTLASNTNFDLPTEILNLLKPENYNNANFKQIKVKNILSQDKILDKFKMIGDLDKYLENVCIKIQYPYIEDKNEIKYLTQEDILKLTDDKNIKYPKYPCMIPTLYGESEIIYSQLFTYSNKIIATSATFPNDIKDKFLKYANQHSFEINNSFIIDKLPVQFDVSVIKLSTSLSLNDRIQILERFKENEIFLVESTLKKACGVYNNLTSRQSLKHRIKFYNSNDYYSIDSENSYKSKTSNGNENIILTYAKSSICKGVDMPNVNLVIVDCSQFLPAIALDIESNKDILDYRSYQIEQINKQIHQIIGRVFRSNIEYNPAITQIDHRKIVIIFHSIPYELIDFKPLASLCYKYQETRDKNVTGLIPRQEISMVNDSIAEAFCGKDFTDKSLKQRNLVIEKAVKEGFSKLNRRTEREILTEQDIEQIKLERKNLKNKKK